MRIARWSLLLVGMLLLTWLIYLPGLNGNYTFDDYPNIVENIALHVTTLDPDAWLHAIWSSPSSEFQRPLASLSIALNHYFSGLDPWPMKATNLLIHLLNGVLLFALLRRVAAALHTGTAGILPANKTDAAGTAAVQAGTADILSANQTHAAGTAALQAETAALHTGTAGILPANKTDAAGTAALHTGTADILSANQTHAAGTAALRTGTADILSANQTHAAGTAALQAETAALHTRTADILSANQIYAAGTAALRTGTADILSANQTHAAGTAALQNPAAETAALRTGTADILSANQTHAAGTAAVQAGTADILSANQVPAAETAAPHTETAALRTGTADILSANQIYAAGSAALQAGTAALQAGTAAVQTGTADILSANQIYAAGSAALQAGTAALHTGTADILSANQIYAAGTAAVQTGTADILSANQIYAAGTAALRTGTADILSANQTTAAGTAAVQAGTADILSATESGSGDRCAPNPGSRNGCLSDGNAPAGCAPDAGQWQRGDGLAVFVTLAWLLHPINLTAVLYVVQRMESLAQLFVLLGLLLYLDGRKRQSEGRKGSTLRLWIGVPLCTLLGLAAKESAVLLPLYALILELTIVRTWQQRRTELAAYFSVFLFIPGTIGLYWLLSSTLITDAYAGRAFTLTQRLLTEPRVLLDYSAWTVFPLPQYFGFYRDDYPLSLDLWHPWTTLPAILGIFAMAIAAIVLRRRRPLVALGLGWFLAAHAMTASIIPLEIAFEHRNYFASIGLLLAAFDLLMPTHWRATRFGLARITLLAGIITLCGLTLAIRAREWSDPVRLAVAEAARHPQSPRASYDLGRTLVVLSGYQADSPLIPKAIAALEAAAKTPRASILPEAGLIMVASRVGMPVEARWWESLRAKLLKRHPTVEDANAVKSLTLCQRQGHCVIDDRRMLSIYMAALTHEPASPGMLYSYAIFAHNRLHDAELALRLAREAASGNDPQYQLNLVNFLIDLGRFKEAEKELATLKHLTRRGSMNAAIADAEKRLREKASTGIPFPPSNKTDGLQQIRNHPVVPIASKPTARRTAVDSICSVHGHAETGPIHFRQIAQGIRHG